MTPQTRRKKFIAKARQEAFQKGRREVRSEVNSWYYKALKLAKNGDWSLMDKGPPCLFTIECSADISDLFTRSQHALDEQFQKLENPASVWEHLSKQ